MEFRDLKRQYSILQNEIDQAIACVLQEANYISGRQVKEFEIELQEYVGTKHCITCANGTDALSLVLMAWGIGKGDAVFVPDFTFFATAEVVAFCGATPIFVDVDENTFNIDCIKLEEAINEVINASNLLPKVIIPVDLFGQPANYKEIQKIAQKYKLLVLEDGAQGFGGKIEEKKACSFGDASTTSFFPAKPLGCYGDGGAIFTEDDELAELLHSLCIHGKGKYKYDNIRIGINSRLDTIQAAILQVKLKAFKEYELENINRAAMLYTEKLKECVKVPQIPKGYYSSWAQYVVQLPNSLIRDKIQVELKSVEIPTMVYYPTPLHKQTAFAKQAKDNKLCETAVKLSNQVLALPIHPYMKEEEIDYVVENLEKVLKCESYYE